MTPRRIFYLEANEDGTVGGSYQALYDLVTRLDRGRYEPVVAFYQPNVFETRLREAGFETMVLDAWRERERPLFRDGGIVAKVGGLARAIAKRRALLRARRADLVHLNNAPSVGADDWLPAARLAGVPCIVTAMGHSRCERHPVHRWLYRSFTHYVAISDHMEREVAGEGVPIGRITRIYLGVDEPAFRARLRRPVAEVRAELGVGDGRLLALMVGNIRQWKGQHVVVEALGRLEPALRERLLLCFAGDVSEADVSYRAELEDLVGRHGLTGTVRFLGKRDDVPDLLRASDIAVHASVHPEPFGLVVPEAMLMECAVVAADRGGPVEVITPQSGVLASPDDPATYAEALTRLVADGPWRRALAQAAPVRAREFSVERMVRETECLYGRLGL